MDESTYNNVYRNASPMTPSTPSNAFQTNVNRTKTRKWVEAKKHNYDGDDWGNDFDDEEEPEQSPAPAVPPKLTAGLRQVGQSVQSPSTQTSGNRAFSQPAAAFGHIRGQSFGRTPSGPPALQIQTQQGAPAQQFEAVEPFPTSDASASSNPVPELRAQEGVASPSVNARSYVPGQGLPARKEYSPAPQDRSSPAPPGAGAGVGAASSPFPPRKSSLGQQDAPLYGDASRSRSGSRSSATARSWLDQRSSSPGRSAPAATGTPNKPLPFIRPADIYRRMEEEKEKERRSMESAGRPSMDSIQGTGSERSLSPSNAVRSPIDQRRRTSLDRDDTLDASRGVRPTLAPVAERRSEYGMDRLINNTDTSIGSERLGQEQPTKPQEIFSVAPLTSPQPQNSLMQSLKSTAEHRKSISPQLPDLARMSGFGTDFFSGSSAFSDSDSSPQATLFDTRPIAQEATSVQQSDTSKFTASINPTPQSSAADPESTEVTPKKQTDPFGDDTLLRAPSLIKGPSLARETESGTHIPPPEPVGQTDSEVRELSPSNDATLTKRSKPSRPSIPGGWVSETTNINSEAPTPMESLEPVFTQLSPVQDVSEVSPTFGMEANDIAPTTTIKHAHALDVAPESVVQNDSLERQSGNEFGTTMGQHDQAVAEEVVAPRTAQDTTPRALTPLQTTDLQPTSISQPDADPTQKSRDGGSPSFQDSPSQYATSAHPHTTTTSSGFTPTAPLNPKRGSTSGTDFVAPGFLSRNMTMSSLDTASPHESDKLREDIIKSLSPVDPTNAFPIPLAAQKSNSASSADMMRESRYLSGVYDDYMGFNEDRSPQDKEQQPFQGTARSASPAAIESSPAGTVLPSEPASSAAALRSQSRSPQAVPSLQRQFSWEKSSEEVTQNVGEETLAHAPTVDSVPSDAEANTKDTKTIVGEKVDTTEISTAPAIELEPERSDMISHQVSMVSSHAPGGLGVSGIEPPSPISVMSAERSPRAMDNASRRLSLADEKSLIQASSHPVSPNLDEDHPALARTPPEPSPSPERMNPVAPPPKSSNIPIFREILSLPTPALRIQKFNEARLQYSSMDSGLSNWMEHMSASPDHTALAALGTSPSNIINTGTTGTGSAQVSPTGAPSAAQQPYYQQYLNASNPNLVSGPTGPTRQQTGNLVPGQPSSSGFGTAKNPVGAKSKEFLQAAGAFGNKATKAGMKSGMKLFNKGKGKLRGSGDKVVPGPQVLSLRPQSTADTVELQGLQGGQGASVHLIKQLGDAQSSSFSHDHGYNHDNDDDPRPVPTSPAASYLNGPSLMRPPGTAASPREPSAQLACSHADPKDPAPSSDLASASAYASASLPALTTAVAPDVVPSHPGLVRPRFHLPGDISSFRPALFRRSRPSSGLLPTADQPLFSHLRLRHHSTPVELTQAHRSPPQPELVSPISTTSIATTAVTLEKASSERNEKYQSTHSAPSGKQQPSWDRFTASALVDEKGFELETPEQELAVTLTPAATQHSDSDAARLTADTRSNGQVTESNQESALPLLSRQSGELPIKMSGPVAASRPVASPLQYPQPEASREDASRSTSFVGLPPIHRTSTFGLLGDRNGRSEDGESVDSPIASSEEGIPPVPAIPSGVGQASRAQQMPSQSQYNRGPYQQSQGFPRQPPHDSPREGSIDGQHRYGSGPAPGQSLNGYHAEHAPAQNGGPAQKQSKYGPQTAQTQQIMPVRVPPPGIPLSQFNAQNQNNSSLPLRQPVSDQSLRSGPVSTAPGGNPVQRLPPQGQWKLEESHLSEPLNNTRRTQSPPSQQPGYYAEDKETESLAPGGPSVPQRSPRNTGLPPVAANRYPNLFPEGISNQSPIQQDYIQVAPASQEVIEKRRDSTGASRLSTQESDEKRQTSLLNRIGEKYLPRGRSDSDFKDRPGVQADEVSVSETSIDEHTEKKHKRASFFGLGSLANNGPTDHSGQQSQQTGPSEKVRTFFGGNPAKPGSGISGVRIEGSNNSNEGHAKGGKKRLSELKGVFKSGSKNEFQPTAAEPAHSGRSSMQGPIRPPSGNPPQTQNSHLGQAQQFGPAGMMGTPQANRGRSGTQNSLQGAPMGLPPDMGPPRQLVEDARERKGSSGFLGNLFGNRPGSSAKDSKAFQGSQIPSSGPYPEQPGQQFRPGQMPPSQPYQRIGGPGQPGFPQGQPGQAFSPRVQPGPSNQYSPASQISQQFAGAGTQGSRGPVPHPQQLDPQFQFATGHRPGLPSQQGSQNTLKPNGMDRQGPLDSQPLTQLGQQQHTFPAPSDDFSQRSSQDHLGAGDSSVMPRTIPNRKPVGSGPSRSASGNVIPFASETSSTHSAVSNAEIQPSRTPEPPNEFGGDGQERSVEQMRRNQGQRLGAPSDTGHVRHPSLPTPSQSPAPMPTGSEAQRIKPPQPDQARGSPLPQQQPFNHQLQANQAGRSRQEGMALPMQQRTDHLGPGPQAMAAPPRQYGQTSRGQAPAIQGVQSAHNPQPWGFTRHATQPNMAGLPGQPHDMQQNQGLGADSGQEQKGSMSRLFGGGGKRQSTVPQGSIATNTAQSNNRESTSSKLLGVFKRPKPQDQPLAGQQNTTQRQQMYPSIQQGGRGQMSVQTNHSGQPLPPQANQAGRGQPVTGRPGGPSPQGSFGAPGQARAPSQGSNTRVGHGQISPTVIPMMQTSRSNTSVQRSEPQYAAVPIPRGYEAVHGYGVPNMLAASPYNVGRTSPPQQFGPQFQPLVPQYTGASQQFQQVMPQHTGTSQPMQQMIPQHTGASQAAPRMPSPAPSQQNPSHGQSHGQPHYGSLQQAGNPAPQQQYGPTQSYPPQETAIPAEPQFGSARSSPHPPSGQGNFLSNPSTQTSETDLSARFDNTTAPAQSSQTESFLSQRPKVVTSMEAQQSHLQLQQTNSPHHQPLPDSANTFSPINAAVGRLSDPPLPPATSSQGSFSQHPASISHTPSPPPAGAPDPEQASIRHVPSSFSVADVPRNNSLGPGMTGHGSTSVSPEPPGIRSAPAQQPSSSNLSVNVSRANNHTPDHDDMYDATPRKERATPSQQEYTHGPASHRHEESARYGLNGGTVAGGAAAGFGARALSSGEIPRSGNHEAEHPQVAAPGQAPLEPEEKILVDQPVELAAVNDDGNDMPMMSATSYPGQEWNPYGAGEFGDWE